MILTLIPLQCFASEIIPPDKTGSITLTMKFEGKPIQDGSFSCIQIADVIGENADYYFRQVLDNTVVYRNGIPDVEDVHQLVNDNPDYFTQENGLKLFCANTTGIVTFSDLEAGLYLIVQEGESAGYTKLNSFLVSVPYHVDGEYIYEVNATVKLELAPELTPASSEPTTSTTPTTPSTTTPPNKIPQTRQLTWPVPVLASSGMVLFILGWWLTFGERKEKYHA